MRRIARVFLLFFLPFPLAAADSVISQKLKHISESLAQAYNRTADPNVREPLAVLNFTAPEKLAKMKAGFAVSELLTHHFVQGGRFIVVERNLVNKLEDEQKFQAMSADTASAVKIGKMLGAKVMALGSIDKISGTYQVNARLVRTESGEILATAFEELPAKTFEEEARPYLSLLPEHQVIGFYGAYQVRPKTKARDIGNLNNDLKTIPHDFNTAFVGVGLRYSPTRHSFIDAGYFTFIGHPLVFSTEDFISPGNISRAETRFPSNHSFTRFLIGWDSSSAGFHWEAGAGFTHYNIEVVSKVFIGAKVDTNHPFVRLGMEYRLQDRFSLGLAGNYEFGDIDAKYYYVSGTAFRMSGISLEPSLSLHF